MKKTTGMFDQYLFYGLLALPVIYTMLYLLKTNQLPVNDAANYLGTAVDIYQSHKKHGVFHFIKACFAIRGWRPILFPDLAVPFLVSSKGDLFVGYMGVALTCLLATIVYVYLYFRLVLDKVSAGLATAMVALLPYIQAQIVMFYAESAFFPLIIGSLYHLISSDFLRKKWHVYGFVALTSLVFMMRPIEAVTHYIFVISAYVAFGCYRGIFTGKQLAKLTFVFLLDLLLFMSATIYPYRKDAVLSIIDNGGPFDQAMRKMVYGLFYGSALLFFSVLGIIFLFYLYQWTMKKQSLRQNVAVVNNYLVWSVVAISGLVLLWYLPFALETFQWIYRTSLGDVAAGTGALQGASFSWGLLAIYLHDEGIFAISVILICCLLGMLGLNKKYYKGILFSLPTLFLLFLTPFPLWEAFYTVQIVTRKLSVAFPALLMIMLIIALIRLPGWRIRFFLLLVAVLLQFGFLVGQIEMHQQFTFLDRLNGNFIRYPSIIMPNPHDVAIAFLDRQVEKYSIHSIGIELIPGTPDARHPIEAEPINPFLLGVMLTAASKDYYANYLYFGSFDTSNVKKIRDQYDAVFLSDRLENMMISRRAALFYKHKFEVETNPSIKTYYQILSYYSANTLHNIGLKLGPCTEINTQNNGVYRVCLLLNISRGV